MTDTERMVAALVEGEPEKAKRELARMLGEGEREIDASAGVLDIASIRGGAPEAEPCAAGEPEAAFRLLPTHCPRSG